MALPDNWQDFRAAAEAAPDPFEAMEYDNNGNLVPIARDMLPTMDLAALAPALPHRKEFAIERCAPAAEVTLLTGHGGAGKSLWAQQAATTAAAGLPCVGLDVQPGPAIYVTAEEDADALHWRQHHICVALAVPMANLAGKLHLVSLRGALDNELATFDQDGTLKPTSAYRRLAATIRATGAKLVFLDNVAHLFAGNENDRGQVTRFVNLLNKLAGETAAAVILIGHPNKSGDTYSGSTAWLNAVRSQFTIDHERDNDGSVLDLDARVLSIGEANYARKGDALRFRWHNWAFVRDEDLPADTRKELADVVKANGENSAFLRCLAACTEKRRAVSHNPGSNYAPKVFAAMPEAKNLSAKALAGAMERLLHLGQIALDQPLWRGPNRVMKQGIKLAEICTDPPAQTPCTDQHETRRNAARFNPLIDKSIPGVASWPATPDDDELDWGADGEGGD